MGIVQSAHGHECHKFCNPCPVRVGGVPNVPKPNANPETEVVPTPQNDRRQRRRFSPDEKARILREADACKERGELGALLRREGIYASHLTNWRAQLRREGVAGLAPKRPGPKPAKDDKDRRIEKLESKMRSSRRSCAFRRS